MRKTSEPTSSFNSTGSSRAKHQLRLFGVVDPHILLVERDKSVFIAECKFWDGPASVTAALDQLLDYATWRDAKAALILFSRNKDFSAVVAAVPGAIASHPQHTGDVKPLSETVFRSRLQKRDDESRLLTVTTLAYNVPTDRSRSARLKPRRRREPRRD